MISKELYSKILAMRHKRRSQVVQEFTKALQDMAANQNMPIITAVQKRRRRRETPAYLGGDVIDWWGM